MANKIRVELPGNMWQKISSLGVKHKYDDNAAQEGIVTGSGQASKLQEMDMEKALGFS